MDQLLVLSRARITEFFFFLLFVFFFFFFSLQLFAENLIRGLAPPHDDYTKFEGAHCKAWDITTQDKGIWPSSIRYRSIYRCSANAPRIYLYVHPQLGCKRWYHLRITMCYYTQSTTSFRLVNIPSMFGSFTVFGDY